jgi:hypothetical protein
VSIQDSRRYVDVADIAGPIVTIGGSPPVVDAIPDQFVDEGELLVVTPTASDVNGDTLRWSGSNLPTGATVDAATGVLTWTPTYFQAGVYPNVTLRADDGHGGTGSASFSITVGNVNRSPTIAPIPNQTGRELETLTVRPVGSDPDGDVLRWYGTSLPQGATVDAATGVLTWRPSAGQAGTYTNVRIYADDNHGAVALRAFSITIDPGPTVGVGEGGAAAPLKLALAFTPPMPFADRLAFAIESPVATRAVVSIWSTNGRRVWMQTQSVVAGTTHLSWDGRDMSGHRVPPGMYLLRVETTAEQVTRRIVKLR